jgi:DNA recombination protein RmuC
MEYVGFVLVAMAASIALGFFIARAKGAGKEAALRTQCEQAQRELGLVQASFDENRTDLDQLVTEYHGLRTELAIAKEQLAAAAERAAQQTKDLADKLSRIATLQGKLSETEQALSSANTWLQSLQEQMGGQDVRHKELREELQQQRDRCVALENRRTELSEGLAAVRASEKEKEQHYAQQLQQLEANKVALKQEFENLANQIFEAKGKAFSEQSRQSLDALLNPFKQQINEFKSKVEYVHLEGTKQQTEVRSELKQLQSMHQQMTQEAHNLATALKGQKKVQGNWGELVLENVLERSGLRLGIDFKREDSFVYEDGGRGRPDVVVYLPQGKHLIIDSKVSLNDYTRYINSEDELERQQAINAHVKAFSDRIQELADRDYYKLRGINSPEMVFMFVPIESAFVEALKAEEGLFQKAIEKHVLVATPTTLLTSLNIVRQLWRFEDQNKHTAELARKADGVFKKLKNFLVSFEGIKNGLERAQASYAKAEGQLVNGPGNLVKQVSEFKQLAPAIKEQLPEYFTEKAELELECYSGISALHEGRNEQLLPALEQDTEV